MPVPEFVFNTSDCCPEGCGPAEGAGGNDVACVEVALNVPGRVALRDPEGNTVVYTDAEWNAFIKTVTDGQLTQR